VELIASNEMRRLLHQLKMQTETDYVVIDATPILATTEPEVLAALVDGIIIVVRAGVTKMETLEQAMASWKTKKSWASF